MGETNCSQIWAGFGGALSADTSLLLYFPFSTITAIPCWVFHHLDFPFPLVGFASQGLGHGGVDAAQAGGADGPARPQKVGAAVAPGLLRKEGVENPYSPAGF